MSAEIGPLDAIDHFAQGTAESIGDLAAVQDLTAGHGIGELFVEAPADIGERLKQEHVHGLDKPALGGEIVGGV